METEPLPKKEKRVRKSTSVSSKDSASGKPKVTKNTTEAKECKKLKTELEAAQNTILALEKKLNDETSKRAELEQLLEEANKKIDSYVKQEVQKVEVEFYDDESNLKNNFLRIHIHKFINALEPFSVIPYEPMPLSICFRLLANYTYKFEKFKKDKETYKNDPSRKNEQSDKWFEKFVYSLKDKNVSDHIVNGGYPKSIRDGIRDHFYVNTQDYNRSYHSWLDDNFYFLQ